MSEEQQYQNREIDHFMNEIHEKLDMILAQTTKTNGRVTKLEEWQQLSKGAIAIITAVLLPLLFIVINKIW